MPLRLNGINPLVDNVMSKRLSQSDKVERKKDEEREKNKKGNYYDQLNISELGKIINSIHEELKDIGNKKALAGFDKIMDLIGRPPNNLVAVNFTDIAAALSEKNDKYFLKLFILAYKIDENDFQFRSWINTLINFELDDLKKHLEICEDYINKSQKEAFENYINSINNIAQSEKISANNKKEELYNIIWQK
ncbi:MAG: hypothetical protein ACQEQF_09680 [Bacillota bacterium]